METENKTRKSFIQLIKFALVGVLNTLVDFVVYSLLVLIFGSPEKSVLLTGVFTFIAYAFGVLNSFIFNTKWTFRQEYKKTTREVVGFIVVNLISWGLSYLLVWLFTKYVFTDSGITMWVCDLIHTQGESGIAKVTSILAKLLATPFVILVNFAGNKIFVFKGDK